jgi:hypothetical protein
MAQTTGKYSGHKHSRESLGATRPSENGGHVELCFDVRLPGISDGLSRRHLRQPTPSSHVRGDAVGGSRAKSIHRSASRLSARTSSAFFERISHSAKALLFDAMTKPGLHARTVSDRQIEMAAASLVELHALIFPRGGLSPGGITRRDIRVGSREQTSARTLRDDRYQRSISKCRQH